MVGLDGRFTLEVKQATDYPIQVGVWADGYELVRSETFVDNGKDREFTFRLSKDRRSRLLGTVRGVDGKPVAGASVAIATATEPNGFNNDSVLMEFRRDTWRRTDDAGRFEFPPHRNRSCSASTTDPVGRYLIREQPASASRTSRLFVAMGAIEGDFRRWKA